MKKPRFGVMLKKKSINIRPYIPFILIIVTYIFIFLLLRGRLLFTPDFDRSDAFHLNISLKYYLAQILKQSKLPLWTNLLQGGFPLFAEGQIGALFLPNIILLRFFDFASAYHALFVLALFFLTTGMYKLLRCLSISNYLALLYSFIFTFCGAVSFRWVHLNVLQSFSLAPLLFWSILRWSNARQFRYACVSALLSSQILFAGHMQIAFIVFLALSLWYLTNVLMYRDKSEGIIRPYIRYNLLLAGSFIIALPQIIPTVQLARYSSRGIMKDYQYATQYSLPATHLQSFISPYLFGNPKRGTYPEFPSSSGIFWENTPYMGEIVSILIPVLYLILLIRKKVNRNINIYFFLALLFILFALGKNSPLYFIYDIFPFNIFRTPAKYLLMAVFFAVIGSSYLTQHYFSLIRIPSLKIFVYVLLIGNLVILVYTAISYHVFVDAKKVLTTPPVSQKLMFHNTHISFGFDRVWHTYFAKNGWKTNKDVEVYTSMNNFLIPNSGLIYGNASFDINTGGLRLRRIDYFIDRIEEALIASDSSRIAHARAENLLQIAGIGSVISLKPFISPLFGTGEKIVENGVSVFLNRIPTSDLPYYIPTTGWQIKYLDDFARRNEKGLVSTSEAVIEGYKDFVQDPRDSVTSYSENENKLTLNTSFPRDTFIVLRRNWYPEWSLNIDGRPAPLLQVNLIHIGLLVPKGNHTVILTYRPIFFYQGIIISTIFILSVMVLIRLRKNARDVSSGG